MNIYCLSCRRKTATRGEKLVTKNRRKMAQGKCASCGTKKSQFVASGAKKKGRMAYPIGWRGLNHEMYA